MLKMSSQIENIVNAYKTLSKIPSITGGKLNNAGNTITVKWSVRNLDKGKSTKYCTSYVLDNSHNVIAQSDFGTDISNELLSAVSPKETYKAIIREEKNGKDVKKQYLEVWNKSSIQHSIDLTALDLHGDVYADSEFGSLDWSQDESAIVYIAEKKKPKSEPFIKRKGEDKNNEGSGEPAPKKGAEFVYRQDWGEQLEGKFTSVIVVCKLPAETVTVLDYLPKGCCPGQVKFSADGSIIGVAWETEPRRLGLIFCTNRPSFIFSLTLNGNMKKSSEPGLSVRSPRVLVDGDGETVVWLQRAARGPHHACHQIVIKRQQHDVVPLIDIVDTEVGITNEVFHGVYCQALPSKCFSNDGSRIVFSTPQANEVRSYVLHIDSGKITDISMKSGSTSVLDVKNDVIIATFSNMTTPGQLFVSKLPASGNEANINWIPVTEVITAPSSVANGTIQYLNLKHNNNDDVKSFTALYFAPQAEAGKKLPLVVWPHGGPHSGFVNSYSLEAALFNMLGFASVQINYRGSTGFGQNSVNFLPKRVGDTDVKDCKLATDEVLKMFPIHEKNLMLFGGSHGGFLVTHLSGQYPDVYSAVVSRNPVTDVAAMFNVTDIGFQSLRVNYRGSIGQGDSAARCLIGRAGSYDVDDCYLALTTIKDRDSTSDVVLYGGSYGGFVVAHLASKYDFKAMVMRNPLVDLATKGHIADNSDGCAVEAGFDFTEEGPISEEQLLAMRRCSPIVHVHKVKAPTAMMLGSNDKRVPYYQGLDYVRRLKANGVETRVFMYEDNHSLSSLPAEMDNLINGANWFLTHLNKD